MFWQCESCLWVVFQKIERRRDFAHLDLVKISILPSRVFVVSSRESRFQLNFIRQGATIFKVFTKKRARDCNRNHETSVHISVWIWMSLLVIKYIGWIINFFLTGYNYWICWRWKVVCNVDFIQEPPNLTFWWRFDPGIFGSYKKRKTRSFQRKFHDRKNQKRIYKNEKQLTKWILLSYIFYVEPRLSVSCYSLNWE